MPSRADTAPRAIASILAQVERLWLFLDRFDVIPAYAEHERIHVLRTAEDRRHPRERQARRPGARDDAVHLLLRGRRRRVSGRLLRHARVPARALRRQSGGRSPRGDPLVAGDLVRPRHDGDASPRVARRCDRGGSARDRLDGVPHIDAPLRRAGVGAREPRGSLVRADRATRVGSARRDPEGQGLGQSARRAPGRQHLARRAPRRHEADGTGAGARRAAAPASGSAEAPDAGISAAR